MLFIVPREFFIDVKYVYFKTWIVLNDFRSLKWIPCYISYLASEKAFYGSQKWMARFGIML